MTTAPRLLIATANSGKLREMQSLLMLPGLELVSLADLRILHTVDEGRLRRERQAQGGHLRHQRSHVDDRR
jgi:inosine/xanthosine triphosphate pyrophosphatase family protein